MASSGLVPLKDIWRMMDVCAPGYGRKERTHDWLVTYDKKSFPSLPRYQSIAAGHVKKMVRFFGIMPCAQREIPRLRN